jgi:hypothetical protein
MIIYMLYTRKEEFLCEVGRETFGVRFEAEADEVSVGMALLAAFSTLVLE